jgi:hypothetical protein
MPEFSCRCPGVLRLREKLGARVNNPLAVRGLERPLFA